MRNLPKFYPDDLSLLIAGPFQGRTILRPFPRPHLQTDHILAFFPQGWKALGNRPGLESPGHKGLK
jgi:hypothetical protein